MLHKVRQGYCCKGFGWLMFSQQVMVDESQAGYSQCHRLFLSLDYPPRFQEAASRDMVLSHAHVAYQGTFCNSWSWTKRCHRLAIPSLLP
jgi:hypothetical protein